MGPIVSHPMKATVVGAGVIGLTSAIRLREAGVDAHIVAAELPAETVASAVAGAIWFPYGSSPDAPEAGWGRASLEVFADAAAAGAPGIALRDMVDLRMEAGPDPWWANPERGFRHTGPGDIPAGYALGYIQQTAVIDVLPHLDYLAGLFASLGGTITRQRVAALADLSGPDVLVVNCAGVGARALTGDADLMPVRGQVVRLGGVELERVTIVDEGPLAYGYVMPHGSECVVGGTRVPGEWDRTPDHAVTERLIEKAIILEPALVDAHIVDVKVGLRPGRSSVRVEHEAVDGTPGIIHNYGHGGNGWSLSWGCAAEVMLLAVG